MRILILFALCFASSAFALTQKDFAMGVGMETRAQRDVNPDETAPKYSGMLFAKLRFKPWDALLETARDERDSSSGSLRVHSESTLLSAWVRYEIRPEESWTPFATAGLGSYFDKVSTSFESSQASKSGMRSFVGLGAGVSATYWDHLVIEGEGRILSLEESKDPVLTGMIRVGCQM
jgi:opacity protein-like surface antigen